MGDVLSKGGSALQPGIPELRPGAAFRVRLARL
jgi:hypothetical protein